MTVFMNAYEVDEAADRLRGQGAAGLAAEHLKEFKDLVNRNSDGWAHWAGGHRAANKLVDLVRNPQKVTPETLKKALVPIKSCITRHKLT